MTDDERERGTEVALLPVGRIEQVVGTACPKPAEPVTARSAFTCNITPAACKSPLT
ncbi:hypothetical protein [Actinophytocola sp.]|uniref:hypothetical protein n=1 Tax=Actinophytocola sp. TaxID=1872138 RepID=UPI003D6AF27E